MNIDKLPIVKVFETTIHIPDVNLESFVNTHQNEFAVRKEGSSFLGNSTKYAISDFTDSKYKASAEFVTGHCKTVGILKLTEPVLVEDAIYFIKKTGSNFSSQGVCMPNTKGLAIAWLTIREEMLKYCEVGRPIYGLDEEQYLQKDNVTKLAYQRYLLPYLQIDTRDSQKFEFSERFGMTINNCYLDEGDMLLYLYR